jgi:glutathione S-transferase
MITLWGRNNSTNVKKVRWVLAELGLPYQHIMAGLEFGLNHDPDYLAMNPNGLVPLLKDDANDRPLGIEHHYSLSGRRVWTGPFVGHFAAQRAQSDKWMDWANGSLSPAHRPVLMGLVRTPADKRDPAAIAAGIACGAFRHA